MRRQLSLCFNVRAFLRSEPPVSLHLSHSTCIPRRPPVHTRGREASKLPTREADSGPSWTSGARWDSPLKLESGEARRCTTPPVSAGVKRHSSQAAQIALPLGMRTGRGRCPPGTESHLLKGDLRCWSTLQEQQLWFS